ncbi:MAG: hypothetical protein JNL53_02225 [Cyclobacteriaceae bacterium]|nr:hypothetical protein [Cyclobacteriaceae bacterium]
MEVNLEKIKQKRVREFIKHYGLNRSGGFSKLQPVCYKPEESTSYQKHFRSFLIKKNIELVWNTYTTIHPKEAWNGEMVSFGLQYSKKNSAINYLNEPYAGMERGQIIILNLSILWGLLTIAVAHEIAEVNKPGWLIKLCYMKGGASEGSQWITLKETPEGFTEVSHLTLYKSNSKFRDTRLYPRLHTKAITEFHKNVKRIAELS